MPKNPRRCRDTKSNEAEHNYILDFESVTGASAPDRSIYASHYSKPYDYFIGSVSQAGFGFEYPFVEETMAPESGRWWLLASQDRVVAARKCRLATGQTQEVFFRCALRLPRIA